MFRKLKLANIKSSVGTYLFVLTGLLFMFTMGCNKKEAENVVATETGILVDTVNKIVYKTVKIGNQWWMAENLRSRICRNGFYLQQVQDSAKWRNDTIGVYCLFGASLTPSGYLYNWNAVNNPNKIAPAGWHIPSDEEWKTLEMYLGMSAADANALNWRGSHEADKLKIATISAVPYWTAVNGIWSTNESGFTALPGSCRVSNSQLGDQIGTTAFWWTSTLNPSNNQAYYRYLDYKQTKVFRNFVSKAYGFSIRCVKD